MKNLVCSLVILICGVSIFSQSRTIERNELNAVLKNGYLQLATKPYRVTDTLEKTVEENPSENTITRSIQEIVPPNNIHQIIEPDQKSGKKSESIKIGDKSFIKDENGKWQEQISDNNVDNSKSSLPPALEKSEVASFEEEYKDLGTDLIDNRKIWIYQSNQKRKLVISSNKEEIESTRTETYWLIEDGSIIKRQSEIISRTKGKVTRTVHTIIYTPDPSIQIKMPALNQ